ncbi:type I restriction-modification system subunit M [Natrononativus amylolyticus]|uniref:type I restriction-modification system subunit M n=1 Tax=Natrononativus amylolyticus TaxID=2963434 RepID=UPI0020CFDDEE|nr:class I SAM-dependent DNA methyltransferase [Natrononativus amylolyticus]
MPNEANQLVNKLWNFCDVLRDDGVSYGDYVEQLTYLLFLKMDEEMTEIGFQEESQVPDEYNWESLVAKDGEELESHYRATLQELGTQGGLLSVIFSKAQNRIQDPAKLRRLVLMIDDENWSGMEVDVKGEIYEGLLQKNAEDVKSGAGQYFTPRPLIKGIVEAVQPEPDQTICDPASGTGGFFLSAHDYITENHQLDKQQKEFLQHDVFKGWEIVDNTARLCVMNLYLHGINGKESPIIVDDSLRSDPGDRFDLILTNPPFGKKSSVTVMSTEGEAVKESLTYERDDFWATTSNKQLNFLQHVKTLLKIGGTAAVVVPDNVLFEGGAGETVRRKLLDQFDVHTMLRLPTGIFYAQGVKANVLFFDAKPAQADPWTDNLWIYDLRTNKHFTRKRDPLTFEDLTDFVDCYNPDNRHEREETERFKSYSYEELMERDKVNLDIFWLKDDSLEDIEDLPEPEVLAADITENLEAALDQFSQIQTDLMD